MRWYSPLGRAGLSWQSAATLSGRGALWQAPLVVAAVRILLLLTIASFAVPGLSHVAQPLVEFLATRSSLHYPQLYLDLPAIFARGDLAIGATVGAIAHAAAVLHFTGAFRRRAPGRVWRKSLRRLPALLAFGVSLASSEWGLSALQEQYGQSLPALASAAILVAARVFARSIFCYAVCASVVYDASIWGSLGAARRMLTLHPATSAILVGVPTVLLDVVASVLAGLDPARAGLPPESMLAAMMAQVALQLLAGFVLIGATTRIFLAQFDR